MYRLPSGKRSPSCVFKDRESARLPASLGGPLRRSPASCAGTPRRVAADWNIAPPPRNGMLIVRCAVVARYFNPPLRVAGSEEHTPELPSHFNLVFRLLLPKKTHPIPV